MAKWTDGQIGKSDFHRMLSDRHRASNKHKVMVKKNKKKTCSSLNCFLNLYFKDRYECPRVLRA